MRAIRTVSWLTALLGFATACSGTALPTTTTDATTTTTEPVTTTVGRVTLTPNSTPLIRQGDRGAWVEALQFYLVCTGHEEPIPGGFVSIDGSYGPITSRAVAYYQAELRRVPSGEPDEETFASLARDCVQTRTMTFADGTVSGEIAGNASSDDPEIFTFAGAGGQILSFVPLDGIVTVTVFAADGTEVPQTVSGARVDADLVAAQAYTIQITASAPTSYRLATQLRSPNVVVSEFGPMKLEDDGIAIADFGDQPTDVVALIALLLTASMDDTGMEQQPGCTGSTRHVTWLIQGDSTGDNHPALFIADFTATGGTPYFSQYTYLSRNLGALDPLARGLTTPDGLTLGSTYDEFVAVYGTPTFIAGSGGFVRQGDYLFRFDIVGGAENPDGTATRIRSISAGDDTCPDF